MHAMIDEAKAIVAAYFAILLRSHCWVVFRDLLPSRLAKPSFVEVFVRNELQEDEKNTTPSALICGSPADCFKTQDMA